MNVAKNAALRPLALCCFASLVQHLPQFVQDFGTEHLVVRTFYSVTKTCESVREQWQRDNIKALAGENDLASEVSHLRATQSKQTSLLERQSEQLAAQNVLLHALLLQVQMLTGNKRPREDDSSVPPPEVVSPPPVVPLPPVVPPPAVSSSVIPPPEVIPARANAFDVMMQTPPTPIEMIPCTLSLYDFLVLWYERGFTPAEYGTRWISKEHHDKKRIGNVLVEINKIATAAAIDIPAVLEARNFSKLSDVCSEIVTLVRAKYAMNGTKFRKPPTLSAIDSKISRSNTVAKPGKRK